MRKYYCDFCEKEIEKSAGLKIVAINGLARFEICEGCQQKIEDIGNYHTWKPYGESKKPRAVLTVPEQPTVPEMPKKKKIDHAKVVSLYLAGTNVKDIAEEVGTSLQTIYNIISAEKKKAMEKEDGE